MSKNRFSEQSSYYVKFRPIYPKELYEFIYSFVKKFDIAWNCGTGNGQVAIELSKKFQKVFASDISENQIAHAFPKDNIYYYITRSEETTFLDNSFDLITVAQAAHWFDLPKFYKEAIRTSKSNSILAIWGYGLPVINQQVDKILSEFYNFLKEEWDPERKHIETKYNNLSFPFKEIKTPDFRIHAIWDLFLRLFIFMVICSKLSKKISKKSCRLF